MSVPGITSPFLEGLSISKEAGTPIPSPPKLRTAHGHFLLPPPSPGLPSPSVLLRGVNLSSTSKFPPFESISWATAQGETREERDKARLEELGWRSDLPADGGWWDEAQAGGREGWFVGRPLKEEEADVHFRRLKAWGFTVIRWVIPWECLEHAGPGKYDELDIQYTIRIMRKAKSHGFRIYISSHQDVFSRFTGGSGAPYWALEACGINPRRVHQTGAAVLQSQWQTEESGGEEGREAAEKGETGEYPDMIWNSNTGRLAARHCFTMFWASGTFAPKCTIDNEPVGDWLQRHFVGAYAHLAKRISEAGDLNDDCLIGWDSINEPHEGFIEVPDLSKIPESQSFRKGPSPTPLQAMQLGIGRSVSNIEDADFGSFGLKKKGTVTMTPPGGEGVWLTREEAAEAGKRWGWKWDKEWDFWEGGKGGCVWAGHDVWDPASGSVMIKHHFSKNADGGEYDFIDNFWKPAYIKYIAAIKQHHPDAIALINPPIFAEPPNLTSHVIDDRAALSSHYYDGLTMMGKRRHLFNADAVGIQRGIKSIMRSIVVGEDSIRSNFRNQLDELSSDAKKTDGIAGEGDARVWPTIIGEIGTPWDMKKKNALLGILKGKTKQEDYEEPAKAMDQLLHGCDGHDPLSYTLWAYEPLNTHKYGDGWNGEDLSLFSYSELAGDDDLAAADPKDLSSLIMLGARGLQSWCRAYPLETTGTITKFDFHPSGKLELALHLPALDNDPLIEKREAGRSSPIFGYTKIYLPYAHYLACNPPSGDVPDSTDKRLLGEPDAEGSEWVQGRGAARIDLKISEISEGTLEVVVVAETRQTERVQQYAKRWDKDSAKDTDAHKQSRLDDYTEVVNGYYDGATELYEFGWAESFHFSRFFKGEGLLQSLARHEHYLAHQLGLQANMRVLDVGCGVGGPAREICRFTDANITGLNNNDFQIQRANQKTRKADLSEKVNFAKGDFMKLAEQFGEESFDAVYAIEATVHAPNFEGIYGEIYKVLKPGGKFGVYEWCMTDAWDPSNPEHKKIAHGIEVGDGIAEMRNIHAARKALKSVGFEILHEEDLANRPDPVPWYYPLEGDLRKAQTWWDLVTCFRTSKVGIKVTQNSVWALEKVGLVPKGTYDVGETLVVAAQNLVAGGRSKLFTPMMLFVVQKPAN